MPENILFFSNSDRLIGRCGKQIVGTLFSFHKSIDVKIRKMF